MPLHTPKIIDLEQRTPEWLVWRDSVIGGSEAAYVMGVSYRGNIKDLWEMKLHLVPEFTPNAAMLRGQELEDTARLELSLHCGLDFTPVCLQHPEFSFVASSLDGISHDGNVITEIKCPGWKTHSEALEGKIRPYYYAQIQQQLAASGAELCLYWSYTDIFKDSRGYKLIEVSRDEDYINRLIQREILFWPYVEHEIEPDLELFGVKDAGNLTNGERTDPAFLNCAKEIIEYKQEIDKLIAEGETNGRLEDARLQYNSRVSDIENLMNRKKQQLAFGGGIRIERVLNGVDWMTNISFN